LQELVTSFAQPSRIALISSIVPAQQLTSAVSLNTIIFNLARFLEPLLAGAGLARLNPTILLGFSSTGYCWFWGVLWYLKIQEEHVEQVRQTAPTSLIQSICTGLDYTHQHTLRGPWLAVFVILCLGIRQLAELLPGVSDLLFHQGVGGLALLSSGLRRVDLTGSIWMSQQPHEALLKFSNFLCKDCVCCQPFSCGVHRLYLL
jgi:hypothetical protein